MAWRIAGALAMYAVAMRRTLSRESCNDPHLNADQRQGIRQQHTKPVLDALHEWMALQRQKLPGSSATAKELDYSLRRWTALTRFVDDGQLPVDNNWIEYQIRPIAIGRSNWLFAGSLRAGQRAAAVMTLVQSARMNGHDPLCLPQGCADAATHAQGHSGARVAAASLASCKRLIDSRPAGCGQYGIAACLRSLGPSRGYVATTGSGF